MGTVPFLSRNVQDPSRAHPTSFAMDPVGSFPVWGGVKMAVFKDDYCFHQRRGAMPPRPTHLHSLHTKCKPLSWPHERCRSAKTPNDQLLNGRVVNRCQMARRTCVLFARDGPPFPQLFLLSAVTGSLMMITKTRLNVNIWYQKLKIRP